MISSLNEAIKHYEEVAEEKEKEAYEIVAWIGDYNNLYYNSCRECAAEHRQLAEWLRELKMWRAYGRRNKDKLPEDMQLMKALNEEVNTDG